MSELKDLQKRIDHIDDQLLILLTSRIALSNELAKNNPKHTEGRTTANDTINRLQRINASQILSDEAIRAIWQVILNQS